jgi:hypothetical protein
MGGSGGSGFSSVNPRTVAENIRSAEQRETDDAFSSDVSDLLQDLLSKFNDRDTDLTQSRITDLLDLLGDVAEGSIATIFGGSVARHTYVDGLSDIDCLLTIKDVDVGDRSPSEILTDVAERISSALPGCSVAAGNLAVTVDYVDGSSIQLLPAIRDGDKVKVASWDGQSWSQINPEKFQKALTKANESCAGKLIPTIKLVKAVNGGFPESNRLTGYHIESLAINIFKQYAGEKSTKAMTEYFYQQASREVLSPIKDRSGQSVHVDEDLGGSGCSKRVVLSKLLERTSKRIKNANASCSLSSWSSLFNEE